MLSNVPQQAIREKKCLELRYNGFSRVVEVHAVGVKNKGGEAMRVWQIRGGSVSGESTGFKLFDLDESFSTHIIDEQSHAPRAGYKRRDSAFKTIYGEV
jgi:hypothetical protein